MKPQFLVMGTGHGLIEVRCLEEEDERPFCYCHPLSCDARATHRAKDGTLFCEEHYLDDLMLNREKTK